MKSLVFKTVQSLRSPALEQKYSLSKCMYMEFFSMESGYMVCVKHIKTWGNIHIRRSKNLSVLSDGCCLILWIVVCFCTCGISASVPSFDLLCDYVVVAVQSLSCVPLFATPWTAAHQALLFFTISQSLFRLVSNELMMPSKLSYPPLPLLLLPSVSPSIRFFFQWVGFSHQMTKVLELQHQSFQWIFRIDFL